MHELKGTWLKGHGVLRTEIDVYLSLRQRSLQGDSKYLQMFFSPSLKTVFVTMDAHSDF